jgi:GTP-binding protein
MGGRNGQMKDMKTENGIVYYDFIIPTRGLFGYRTEFLTDTKGMGIINTVFYDYDKDPGNWKERNQGSLVAHETGETNLYGLLNVQDRGQLFLGPNVQVYEGQVVGTLSSRRICSQPVNASGGQRPPQRARSSSSSITV